MAKTAKTKKENEMKDKSAKKRLIIENNKERSNWAQTWHKDSYKKQE